jgi:hypothetical protein
VLALGTLLALDQLARIGNAWCWSCDHIPDGEAEENEGAGGKLHPRGRVWLLDLLRVSRLHQSWV